MLKLLQKKWDKNRQKLYDKFKSLTEVPDSYEELVKLVFDIIYNDGELAGIGDFRFRYFDKINKESITEVQYGAYGGSLFYIIPFCDDAPASYEILMTFAEYGSCSGCDTLEWIKALACSSDHLIPDQIDALMALSKDLVMATVHPYNIGWRNVDGLFEQCEQ